MPLSNRVDTARIKRGIPMTASELAEMLQLRLAKYGLSVTAVTESPHTPTTGVIMTPKGTGGAERIKIPSEARRLPKRSIPSRATQDLLNGHWQRDTVDDGNFPDDLPKEEGECHVLS